MHDYYEIHVDVEICSDYVLWWVRIFNLNRKYMYSNVHKVLFIREEARAA